MSVLSLPAAVKQYLQIAVFGGAVLIVLGLTIALSIANKNLDARTNERDRLQVWQDDVITDLTTATVEPDDSGKVQRLDQATAKVALKAVITERNTARAKFREINFITQNEKRRADEAEQRLKAAQAQNAKNFAKANRKIEELETAQATGNADEDIKLIDDALDAAWKGWK